MVTFFDCPWCSYQAKRTGHLAVHLRKHTGERPYKCVHSKCPASFATNGALRRHQMVHTKERKFECPTCHKKFGTKSDLLRHQRIVHGGERPFACPLCPYTAKQKDCLLGHMTRIHSDAKPFKCGQCGYAGKTERDLSYHSKVHLTGAAKEKVKIHGCPHCPKKFVHSSNLTRHLLTHTKQRPFPCPISHCQYGATSSCSLRVHIAQVHTKEKKFKCTFCHYAAVSSNRFNEHMRTHTGEKPYQCQFNGCKYVGATASTVREHGQVVHLGVMPFKCSRCPYGSMRRHHVAAHETKIHDVSPLPSKKWKKTAKN